jgi:hypothetical protein
MTENETKLLKKWAKTVAGMTIAELHDRQDSLWLEDAIKWAENLPDGSTDRITKLLAKVAEKPE